MKLWKQFSLLNNGGLLFGGLIQLASYLGMFMALVVAGRVLSATEFGLYAGLTATASLAGGTLTVGADKMLMNLAARQDTRRYRHSIPLASQSILFVVVNSSFLLIAAGLFLFDLINEWQILTAILASAIATKLLLGGYLRGIGRIYIGLVAIFSLQPLFLAILFGILSFTSKQIEQDFANLETWLGIATAIELVFVFWFAYLARPIGFQLLRAIAYRHIWRLTKTHLAIALRVTIWNLLAQSSLLSVAIVTAFFSPIQVGEYGLAARVSQILLMPWNSGMQILIPKMARYDRNRNNADISSEAKNVTRLAFVSIVAISIVYLIFGFNFMSQIFSAFNRTAFSISLVFLAGNIIFSFFGIGDQGLIAMNQRLTAQRIAMVSSISALIGYAAALFLKLDILYIAIIMTSSMIIRQTWSEHKIYEFSGIRTRFSFC